FPRQCGARARPGGGRRRQRAPVPHPARLRAARGGAQRGGGGLRRDLDRGDADPGDGALGRGGGPRRRQLRQRLQATLRAGINERGGVINIALEGMMLNGALAYTLGAYWTGDPWAGVAAALLAGALTGALHALVTVAFRADQITSGLGINLLAAGLTRLVLKA